MSTATPPAAAHNVEYDAKVREMANAAQGVILAVERSLAKKPVPQKFGVPFEALNRLRKATEEWEKACAVMEGRAKR